ncbi:AAA family ATPase [Streptomyces olivaceoviridis]|uniref:AAA family ATPase n=1 Tax=Streptomyces olivaceoviridis TaxID=1921 RepID=UPI0036775668
MALPDTRAGGQHRSASGGADRAGPRRRGERLIVLIGASGAGKSTLARTWPASQILSLDARRSTLDTRRAQPMTGLPRSTEPGPSPSDSARDCVHRRRCRSTTR